MTTLDEILEHHGIKGMKWGVRRSESELASVSGNTHTSGKASADAKAAAAAKAKIASGGTDTLSNKELQTVVTRMNLEQQYSRLNSTPSEKTLVQKGGTEAKKILQNTARQGVQSLANQVTAKAIAKLLAKGAIATALA